MFLKRKILRKVLAFILIIQLLVNPLIAGTALAQEATPEPTSVPEITVTPAATETPLPPASVIETGNADSGSQTQTTANVTEDIIPGSLNDGVACTPPEGQSSCPNDIEIANDNSADIQNKADSSAATGENTANESLGDVVISTGDASASGTIESDINKNVIELDPAATPSGVSLPNTPSITVEEDNSLTVENKNDAEVKNEAKVEAATGENIASENIGDVKIDTGDAASLANVLNFINTNIVGSNFQVVVLDLNSPGSSDINLNDIWKQILESNPEDSLTLVGESAFSNLTIRILNENKCKLENNIEVTAQTGENNANNNHSSEINTGDATALANVNNFVNTNIIGSKFLFAIINILTDNSGNLILPRPERFLESSQTSAGTSGGIFQNENLAAIENNVESNASTGENVSKNNGINTIDTGSAGSVSNSVTYANLSAWLNSYFYFRINNLSGWNGDVLGWESPDSSNKTDDTSKEFQVESEREIGGVDLPLPTPPQFSFQNQNEAEVVNNISTKASTGGNSVENNETGGSIETGNALASSNLFNMVNLNLIGSKWFFGMVNILGNWTGNTIFAYPDLSVSLSKENPEVEVGAELKVSLSYENKGYDDAEDSNVKLIIPLGTSYLSDSSCIKPVINGSEYSWMIGDLKPGQKGEFLVKLKVNSDFNFENLQGFWQKIIKDVYAAENFQEKTISLVASISTGDPETDRTNNSSSIETVVFKEYPEEQSGDGIDHRQPKLEITAWNNVNGYVFPGDTVSFEITVKNTSDVPSYNTVLYQNLYNGGPEDFGFFKFNLGTIYPGKQGKLSFGLKLPNDGTLKADDYRTITQIVGKANDGTEVRSNEAKTFFEIKLIAASFVPQIAHAAEEKEAGEVLGTSSNCPITKEILPYVLLFTLSSFYLSSWIKYRLMKGFNV